MGGLKSSTRQSAIATGHFHTQLDTSTAILSCCEIPPSPYTSPAVHTLFRHADTRTECQRPGSIIASQRLPQFAAATATARTLSADLRLPCCILNRPILIQ